MRSRMRVILGFVLLPALWLGAARGEEEPAFQLTSDAFAEGAMIPVLHTCDGADRSPPLHWDGTPSGTKALALIVDDPDAPGGTFTHWLLYNVPAGAKSLTDGIPPAASTLGDGSRQGKNDFKRTGYGGPCPPKGSKHRYYFRLYALSRLLEVEAGAPRDAVEKEIKDAKLAETELKARYAR